MSKIIIISGMHRSGTSMTANWFHKCGLFIGDDLIPADMTNKKGHFEEKSISYFQRRILEYNGADYRVQPNQKIEIPEYFYHDIRSIIEPFNKYDQWGWKEPRSTLMLNFWKEVIPHAYYFFVFRRHDEVVSSLIRRSNLKKHRYTRFKDLLLNNKKRSELANVWRRYNNDLVSFAQENQARTLVFYLPDILKYHDKIINFINENWGFNLSNVDIHDIWDTNLFTKSRLPLLSNSELKETWTNLKKLSKLSSDKLRI